MPANQARFTIAVGARSDRSVRTALGDVNKQISGVNMSIKDQQRQARLLTKELQLYGNRGATGTRDLKREILATNRSIETQRSRVGELIGQQRRLNRELRNTQRDAGLARRGLGALARVGTGRLAALGGVAGLGLLLRGGAQQARTIGRQAALTGLDAQETQTTLDFFTAVNIENPESALTQLTLFRRRIGEAIQRPTGREASAFEQLGLDVQELSELNAPEALLRISQALSQVENEAIRTSLAADTLGRGFAVFAPIIAQGERAQVRLEEIRTTWTNTSNAAVAANDRMGESFQRSGNELTNLRLELSAAFAPAVSSVLDNQINPMLSGLVNWTAENQRTAAAIGVTTTVVAAGSGQIATWGEQLFFASQGVSTVRTGVVALRNANIAGTAVQIVSTGAQAVATGVTVGLSVATTALGVAVRFALGPIGLAITVIGALVAVGIYLYKNWDTVKVQLTGAFNAIADAGGHVVNFLIGGWNKLVSVGLLVPRAYLKIAEVVTGIIRRITFGKVDIDLSPIRQGIDALEDAAQIDARVRTNRVERARVSAAVDEERAARDAPAVAVETAAPQTAQAPAAQVSVETPAAPAVVVETPAPQVAQTESRARRGRRAGLPSQTVAVETPVQLETPQARVSRNDDRLPRQDISVSPVRDQGAPGSIRNDVETQPAQLGSPRADTSAVATVAQVDVPELRISVNRLIASMDRLAATQQAQSFGPRVPPTLQVTVNQTVNVDTPAATTDEIADAVSERNEEIVERVREAVS